MKPRSGTRNQISPKDEKKILPELPESRMHNPNRGAELEVYREMEASPPPGRRGLLGHRRPAQPPRGRADRLPGGHAPCLPLCRFPRLWQTGIPGVKKAICLARQVRP